MSEQENKPTYRSKEKKQGNIIKRSINTFKRRRADRQYEKELNKSGRTSKRRSTDNIPYRQVERRLSIAIAVTFILLVVVMIFVFFV